MNLPENSPLGKASAYADQYDASLLFPIPRSGKRAEIGISAAPPFFGADLWTAFELSWLNQRGKPQVALAHITVPCESPNIIESKSFKLYLNSFNSTRFLDAAEVQARLRADLSEAAWRGAAQPSSAGVRLLLPELFDREPVHELDGLSLDRLDVECTQYTPAPELLRAAVNEPPVTEVLTSNLLKSNCLITGQPYWARHQPVSHQPSARPARQRAHGAAVKAAAKPGGAAAKKAGCWPSRALVARVALRRRPRCRL